MGSYGGKAKRARWIRASVPYQTSEVMERFVDGMRKAGLTED